MRFSGILLSTAILSFCFASQSQSQVYRSTDAEGNVTFSDQPTAGSEKEVIPPTNVGDSVEVPPPEPVSEPKKAAVEEPPAAPEGRLVGVEKDDDDSNWRRRPRVIHRHHERTR